MGTALRRSRRWGDVSGLKTVIVIGLTAATEEVRLHLKCQTVKLLMFLGYRHSYTKISFWSGLLGAPVLFDQGPTVRTQPQETLINDLSLKPSYRKKFLGPVRIDCHGQPWRHARTMHWSIRPIQRSIQVLPAIRKCNVQASFT
jgi:hypothetical protein